MDKFLCIKVAYLWVESTPRSCESVKVAEFSYLANDRWRAAIGSAGSLRPEPCNSTRKHFEPFVIKA
jgi:hypothetical protein